MRRVFARARIAAVAVAVVSALALSGCAAEAVAVPSPPEPSASFTAGTGDVLGGTEVFTGHDLDAIESVRFGEEPGTITMFSDTELVVAVPPAVDYQPGSVPVTLETADGSAASPGPGDYVYEATSPVGKQLAYALKYWKHYNTSVWGDLNPVGGDCANFVSQTLIARGLTMTDEWYNHDAAADWAPAWGYVPAMDDYFAAHADELGLVRLEQEQRDRVALGDVAVFDEEGTGSRDHVEVVDRITVGADGHISIAFASHNNDYDYRDLDDILADYPGSRMHFWHFTSAGDGS